METFIILHALDVAARDSSSDLYIPSPGTNVLPLLMYFHPRIDMRKVFNEQKRKEVREIYIR